MKLYEAGKVWKQIQFLWQIFPPNSNSKNSLADQQNDSGLLGNIMDQRVSSLAADHNQLGGLKNLELTPLILIGLLSVPTGF